MPAIRFFLIILLSGFLAGGVLAQGITDLPVLSQGSVKQLDLSDGLPDRCVKDAFIDKKGRLWLVSCDYVQIQQGLHLYQFDGYRAQSITLGISESEDESIYRFEGIGEDERMYGFVSGSQTFFFYNPDDATTEEHLVQVADSSEYIISLIDKDGALYITTLASEKYAVYLYKDGIISKIIDIPIDQEKKMVYPELYRSDVILLRSELWIWAAWHPVYRINLLSKNIRQYEIPELPSESMTPKWSHRAQLAVSPQKELWIYSSESKQGTFFFDKVKDQISALNIIPEQWDHVARVRNSGNSLFFSDDMGNMIIDYLNKSGQHTYLMRDPEGNMYNYTPVLAGIDLSSILSLTSHDFREIVQIVGTPYSIIEVQSSKAITPFAFGWTRGIAEIQPDTLFIYGLQSVIIDTKNETITRSSLIEASCDCDMLPESKILKDDKGRLWTIGRFEITSRLIVEYDPVSGKSVSHIAPVNTTRMEFIASHLLVMAADSNLFFYDTRTDQYEILSENGRPFCVDGTINDVLVSRDGAIWVASTKGIWKIERNRDKNSHIERIDTSSTSRNTVLHESSDGKIWIGTFLGGIRKYDPVTGDIKLINKDHGLSHNAVATILEDNNGRIWVGTYHGITVLSPDGDILTKIYVKDGLVDNECNRWSSYKMTDGRLCFGSVSGISIIDPDLLMRDRQTRQTLSIFFTAAKYRDHDDNREVVLTHPVEFATPIILSAGNRSLQLSFSLSDYFNVESHNFAYKLERRNEEWNFIGSTHDLNLNSLPAGKYNILVKGSDMRGNWTTEPISITVEVQEFFYLKWWFYVLCTLPFLLIAMIWIWRQSKARHNLEIEVAERTQQIREQSEKLKKMDQIKSRLYTNITHEFRTPLTVIMGLIDQIRGEKSPLKIDTNLNIVQRNSASLLTLVNQMLDLRKLESGSMPVAMIQADVMTYLQYLSESFRSLASAKSLNFHFLAETEELIMDYDPEKLERIVSNLLGNAIKFTPEGGDIYFQAGSPVGSATQILEIKVRDTGIGIPPDQIDHVFDQFYQVDDSETRIGEGTGIGLTLVAEIIKLLNGKIAVMSNQAKGTTFTVQLPITQEAPMTDSQNLNLREGLIVTGLKSEHPPDPIETNPGEGIELPMLLLVEDNADVVHFLVTTLSEAYQIKIAMNGQEGIDKAIEFIPDLILSDVMMPIRNGFELCDTLKTDIRTSHIPIILLTAKADAESRISGLQHGADAYLAKPFHKEELLVRLEKLLQLRKTLQKKYMVIDAVPQASPEEGGGDVQLENEFLRRIRDAIEKNIDDADFGVMQLCQAMNLGRTQIHRKIKALTSRSTSSYIRFIRLHKAKKLLADDRLNVSEVAYSVGFRDPLYFSRVFKEEIGVAPSHFQPN